MSRFKRVSIPSAGGYDKLHIIHDREPTRGPNVALQNISEENLVRIRVSRAGVNYADVCVRWGLYESARRYVGWPITPGFEVSGVVEAVGGRVNDLSIGDRVFAVSMFGGYSSSIEVPRSQCFRCPDELNDSEAASFPAVSLTSWLNSTLHFLPSALNRQADVSAGDFVLVHSAAGGVGSMLVQMAKIKGCKVVGVVGAKHKVDSCISMGCDLVIDKSTTPDIWEVASNFVNAKSEKRKGLFKAIFDANGTDLLAVAMEEILGWLKRGQLSVVKVKEFDVSEVAKAHAALESGQTIGKLVLRFT
eukprot:UC4_evm2s521